VLPSPEELRDGTRKAAKALASRILGSLDFMVSLIFGSGRLSYNTSKRSAMPDFR
jgi:hypothetical protein